MDIRQMQCFAEVAKAGSINKAADNLYVTRQALSKTISKLEDELGAKLFDIDYRGARLTARGSAFLDEVAPLLASYERIESKFCALKKGASLGVALGKGTIYPFPDDFILRFCERCPGVEVSVEEIHSVGVLQMVEEGEVEIGVLCTHPKYLGGFEQLELIHPGFTLSVPKGNPLSEMERVELADLDGAPFVTLGERNHVHRFFMEQCERANVRPNIVVASSNARMLELAQLRECAISFTCTPGFAEPCDGVRLVPLAMAGSEVFGSYAIKRRDVALSALGQQFWDYMADYIESVRSEKERPEEGERLEGERCAG